ncbi:MAG TPA: transposase [Candidatus Eisenbacteria bacterium]
MGTRHRSEREIRSILAEAAGGASIEAVARRHGMSRKTLYRWRARFESPHARGIEHPRSASEENERLKRLVAEQALQIHTLKEMLGLLHARTETRNGSRGRSAPARRRRS